jgi:RNA polymerase sigma-70 factor (ECF subfamily)
MDDLTRKIAALRDERTPAVQSWRPSRSLRACSGVSAVVSGRTKAARGSTVWRAGVNLEARRGAVSATRDVECKSNSLGASGAQLPPQLQIAFEQHADFVCRILRSLGVRETDLDDTLQEVFLVVARRQNDYEEHGRARAWMYSICKRVAIGQRRKYRRDRETTVDPFPEPSIAPTQLNAMQEREALDLGHQLLKLLPQQQREIFLLYEVEDMSMREIARLLRCPLQTAYSRLHKARRRVVAEVERMAAERDYDDYGFE